MAHFNAAMGGAAITKEGGTSKIGQKRIGRKENRRGRRGRHNLQPRGRSTAADNIESGEHENGGTLGEPPPPLGGGW